MERATKSEDMIYLGLAFWTLAGLCIDGWSHLNQPELESFLTPWHAVFYSGFSLSAGWVGVMTLRRRARAASLVAAVPCGYGLAIIGLIVFGAGGVGDAVWHHFFGIETGLDALLSPTHLLLMIGLLLGSTAPFRAAWHGAASPVGGDGLGPFLPPVLSLAAGSCTVGFFFLYANAFNNWPVATPFTPGGAGETEASLGVLFSLTTTVLLVAPMLLMIRRWRPPAGTFTLMFGIFGVFLAGLDAFASWWQVLPPLVGGLTADLVCATRGASGSTTVARAAGALVPLTMISSSMLTFELAWGVEWPPELWLGAICLSALAGWGLAVLSHPPELPGARSGGPPALDPGRGAHGWR